MLHLLQMGPSKVLTTFSLQIQSSWQLSLLELPPSCCVPSDSSDLYTSTVQSSPPSANAALLPHPRLQSSNLLSPSAHSVSSPSAPSPLPLAPGCPSTPSAFSFPVTPSGFSNGMLEVFKPGTLNCYTFFRPTALIFSASRNPILPHLPLFRFLNSLLCVLIAPTPGLAFSLVMPRTLAAASLFSSGRAYPCLNFLLPPSLRLILTLIM